MTEFVDIKYQNTSIMIIDDEPAVCEGLAFTLTYRYGFKQIDKQIFPSAALKELEQSPETIDVIILDLKMPEIDGFTMLTRIKEINPAIAVIIMSAYAGLDEVRTALIELKRVFNYQDNNSKQLKPAILDKNNKQDIENLPKIICQAYQKNEQ